ncbi:MAG: recombinase family protein [Comamonadaceae bacterium]|nr:MAG: recombinase family protein [Comamonadaceae bacterium]
MMMRGRRALVYTRVSKDDSGEGRSNRRQEDDCRKLADLRGWEVVGVEEDISVSAYTGKTRPGWQRVLDAVKNDQADVIIAWHLDRMTRSMVDLEELIHLAEGSGVGVATVSGDIDLTQDVGRMVARILAAVARAEVERKSARQRLANQQRAAEGKPWSSGFRAFGYALDGTVLEGEAEHVRMAALDALEGTSMKELERRWGSLGLRSVHAKDDSDKGWTARGIRNLLLNPRYAGLATYRGKVVGPGAWEPILTEDEHAQLRLLLTDPARRTTRRSGGRVAENLLSGIARCESCGDTVNAKRPHGVSAYCCIKGCLVTVREEAEAYVVACLETAMRQYGPGQVTASSTDKAVDRGDETSGEAPSLEDIAERQRVVTGAYLRGDLDSSAYEETLADIAAQRREVEVRAAHSPGPTLRRVSEGAEDFMANYRRASLAGQRRTISELTKVTLIPRRRRRSVPIAQQVSVSVRLHGEWVPVVPGEGVEVIGS